MYNTIFSCIVILCLPAEIFAQDNPFEVLDFLVGTWGGNGTGFGNEGSTIQSEFRYIMDGKYLQVMNESRFEPTETKPAGDYHLDMGMISYDTYREKLVYRQFHNEGYVNQYILKIDLSNDTDLVFESETIENFPRGGVARWTIRKLSENEIETIFDVAMPDELFVCLGTNKLEKIK